MASLIKVGFNLLFVRANAISDHSRLLENSQPAGDDQQETSQPKRYEHNLF